MSGHINEEDVNYTLITTTGRIESYTSGDRSRYTKKQTIYKSGDPHSVLSYGDTLSDRVDIIAHEDELKSADYKFIFVLLFGGRKSPQKRCDYNFDCNSWNAETPQDGLVRANENKLIIDHVIEKGFTKADIIRFAEERIYP